MKCSIMSLITLFALLGCTQQAPPLRQIQSLNIATKDVKGESLFGEAVSKIEMQKNSVDSLNKAFSNFPQAAYKYEPGKFEIISIEQATNIAKIKIPMVIKLDERFIDGLDSALGAVSEMKVSNIELYNLIIKDNVYVTNKYYICTSSLAMINKGMSSQCFRFDRSTIKAALKYDGSLISHIPGDSGDYSVKLVFSDLNGNTIEASNIIFDYDYSYTNKHNFNGLDFDRFLLDKTGMALAEVKGSFASERYQPPNILDSQTILLFVKDGYMPLSVIVELSVDDLKKITKLEVFMNSYKQQDKL